MTDPAIVATLGQLVKEARMAGIPMSVDEKGRPYYQLQFDGKYLSIGSVVVEKKSVGKKLWSMVDEAIKAGIKPRKDKLGNFLTLVYQTGSGQARIETTTESDMTAAKAQSPRIRA